MNASRALLFHQRSLSPLPALSQVSSNRARPPARIKCMPRQSIAGASSEVEQSLLLHQSSHQRPQRQTLMNDSFCTIWEQCSADFKSLCQAFSKRCVRFRKDVDSHYSGWKVVHAHRTACYQAFAFVEKRFNDRRESCQRLVGIPMQDISDMITHQKKIDVVVSSLRAIKSVAEWLEFSLFLYEKRDGYPYNRKLLDLTTTFDTTNTTNLSTKDPNKVVELVYQMSQLNPVDADDALRNLHLNSSALTLMRALICDARKSKGTDLHRFSVGMQQSSHRFGNRGTDVGHGVLGVCSTKFQVQEHPTMKNCLVCTGTYTNQDVKQHHLISLTTYVQSDDPIVQRHQRSQHASPGSRRRGLLEVDADVDQESYERKEFTNQYYRTFRRNLNQVAVPSNGGVVHVQFWIEHINECQQETLCGMWEVDTGGSGRGRSKWVVDGGVVEVEVEEEEGEGEGEGEGEDEEKEGKEKATRCNFCVVS